MRCCFLTLLNPWWSITVKVSCIYDKIHAHSSSAPAAGATLCVCWRSVYGLIQKLVLHHFLNKVGWQKKEEKRADIQTDYWSWPEWSHVKVTPETVKLEVQHEQNRNVKASKRGSCDMFPFSVSWDPRPGLQTVNERNIDLSCRRGLLHFSSGLDFIALFSLHIVLKDYLAHKTQETIKACEMTGFN